jgi:hypothetical protein
MLIIEYGKYIDKRLIITKYSNKILPNNRPEKNKTLIIINNDLQNMYNPLIKNRNILTIILYISF